MLLINIQENPLLVYIQKYKKLYKQKDLKDIALFWLYMYKLIVHS